MPATVLTDDIHHKNAKPMPVMKSNHKTFICFTYCNTTLYTANVVNIELFTWMFYL